MASAFLFFFQNIMAAVLASMVVASTVPYILLLLCWMLISRFVHETWFHQVEDALWGLYQKLVVFAFEHCTGVEVYVSGSLPKVRENSLVISNHQCMVDWIIADFIALRQGMVGNMRYVFKNSLKYYPLFGFAFGMHGGVFVRRDGKHNDRNMKRVMETLVKRKADLYFLIYPEGTRFTPHREAVLNKSRQFAVASGLKPLNQVLTPRVKAFDCSLAALKGYAQAVYDLTVVYDVDRAKGKGTRPKAPNLWQFLAGRCERVYVHFDRIPIDEVLRSISIYDAVGDGPTSGSMKWLHHRFELKDQMLEKFYFGESGTNHLSKEEGSTAIPPEVAVDVRNGKRSFLPLASTLPSFAAWTLLQVLLLYFPLGRLLYLFTATVGVLVLCVYAHCYL